VAYSPNAKFWFNRAYLSAWQLGVYPGWTLLSHSNPIVSRVDFGGGIYQDLHFLVRSEVWDASTNTYSLDYVVERAWNTFSFLPGEFDTTFNVTWQNGGANCGPSIIMDAGGPTKFFLWNALRTPLPHWLQLPTCDEILA
jgi:hypothetical protein